MYIRSYDTQMHNMIVKQQNFNVLYLCDCHNIKETVFGGHLICNGKYIKQYVSN